MNKTTGDRLGPLTAPGFAATLMAPDNNAMNSLFDKLGGLHGLATREHQQLAAMAACALLLHLLSMVPGNALRAMQAAAKALL